MSTGSVIRITHEWGRDEYQCPDCGYTSTESFDICPRCGDGKRYCETDRSKEEEECAFMAFMSGLI